MASFYAEFATLGPWQRFHVRGRRPVEWYSLVKGHVTADCLDCDPSDPVGSQKYLLIFQLLALRFSLSRSRTHLAKGSKSQLRESRRTSNGEERGTVQS
jgi:hypothetical protein